MPEPMRVERTRDSARDGFVDRTSNDSGVAQHLRDLTMRFVVERLVGQADADRSAESLLESLEPVNQLREGGRRGAAPLDPRARHVGPVPAARGARVDEERFGLTLLGPPAIRNMVQRSRVPAEGDDVLVRRLPVVLLRRAKVKEVQVELRRVAVTERLSQRVVARPCNAVGLDEASDFVRGL